MTGKDKSSTDKVYQEAKTHIVDFAFNEDVTAVFPDMIRRSVPGYELMVPVTGLMAARHLGEQGTAWDLGCSLGATTTAILQQNPSPEIHIQAVDNSPAMIEQARQLIRDPRVTFTLDDVLTIEIEDASVIILNLVMQFIAPEERVALLKKLHAGLRRDGILLISEKVCNEDDALEAYYDTTHLAWKAANGYSNLEISQKRTALENVMRIDSEQTHLNRFEECGFSSANQWFRCLNWASFIVRR